MFRMNIIEWDISVFKWINSDLSNPVFDFMLPLLREPLFWMPLYIFIIGFVLLNYGKTAYWLIIFAILTVGTSDLVSSRVIKKSIKRLRPCNTEYLEVNERVRCGSGYSFTSSHATNHFAVASFLIFTLGLRFKRIKPWLWIWAGSVSFAQVYVGVHFPLDILAGSLIGILIGYIWSILFFKYYPDVLGYNKSINEA